MAVHYFFPGMPAEVHELRLQCEPHSRIARIGEVIVVGRDKQEGVRSGFGPSKGRSSMIDGLVCLIDWLAVSQPYFICPLDVGRAAPSGHQGLARRAPVLVCEDVAVANSEPIGPLEDFVPHQQRDVSKPAYGIAPGIKDWRMRECGE